ncbi:MAG: DUF4382 domain-containing protein [Ramlibacter sp.]|nr:DUF4382 domain-containing protein [Ramlibacter sp.]
MMNVAWARTLRWGTALGTAAMLAACGGGGGDASFQADGSLRVALTDAPSCGYDHVYVTVEKVRVHQSGTAADAEGGWREIAVAPARRIDLLELNNGLLEELGTVALPSGRYSQLRLVLSSNTATGTSSMANAVQPTGGALTALDTPSGQQSGLKLQAHFDVAPGQMADLVLDFDACKSVVKAGNSGKYNLKPVISILPRVNTGIHGYVTTTLSLSSTTVAAQVNGATIRSTAPDSTGKFSIPYLSTGTYTLVVMSDGRATAVVTGVPVGTGTTVVSGTATAIAPPLSTMADVTGAATLTSVSGGGTTTTAITDATVQASQALTGGPAVVIASQAIDPELGTYRFRLPVGAPVKAAFVSSGAALSFAADAAAAGKYTIRAETPGRATQDKPADISGGSVNVNFSYGP